MNNDPSFEGQVRHFIQFWSELDPFEEQVPKQVIIEEEKTNSSKWDGNEVEKQPH